MIWISSLLLLLACQSVEEVPLRTFVGTWCLDCHQEPRVQGDLDLAVLMDRVEAGDAPDGLARILDRLERRDMPPAEFEQPDETSYQTAIGHLEQIMRSHALEQGSTPRSTIARRLNRFEYANSVRALLELDARFDAEDRLPVDEIADGFDNSGDVLSVSPLLLEKYFTLAELASLRAFPQPGLIDPEVRVYEGAALSAQGAARRRGNTWRMSSRSTVRLQFTVEVGGPYRLRAIVRGQQAGPDPVRMALSVDGDRLNPVEVPDPFEVNQIIEVERVLDPGSHVLAVSFLNDYYQPNHPDPSQRDRNAAVDHFEIEGPLQPAFPSAIQKRLVDDFGPLRGPETLRKMVQELAERAWRRPVEPELIDQLCSLGPPADPPWIRVRDAMTAILVHPRFLFRIEPGLPDPPQIRRPLDDWEIATRLSYFLWSTTPDDSLRVAASNGALSTPEGRRRQVRRMLEDDRIRALGEHFATQWLQIRTLTDLRPAESQFPEVDEALLFSMHEETRRFFDQMLAEDLPITRLLDADWTWLDPALAEHYGIPGVTGGGFRKVSLVGDHQSTGILRHASILLATSNPTRTSPVKRGKWILEALLDDAPPPPPPGIPNLPDGEHLQAGATLRQIMEQHRADPNCAACHLRMDAMGFSLERFDAVGRYREVSINGMSIDDRGELPDGTVIDGAVGLRDELLRGASRERFQRSLLKRLLIYALGRGLDHRDDARIDQLMERLGDAPSLRRMILEIIESQPFLHRYAAQDAMMEAGDTP